MQDTYEYDIISDTWSTESSSLPRRIQHACISIEGESNILVAGGYYNNNTEYWYSTSEIYDTESKIWSNGPNFPKGLHATSMVQASPNSKYVGYIFGGFPEAAKPVISMTDIFGVTKDLQNIVKLGDLQKGRMSHRAIKLPSRISDKC